MSASVPPSSYDDALLQVILQHGWLTREQAKECQEVLLRLQHTGRTVSLDRLLVARNLLTQEQVDQANQEVPIEPTFPQEPPTVRIAGASPPPLFQGNHTHSPDPMPPLPISLTGDSGQPPPGPPEVPAEKPTAAQTALAPPVSPDPQPPVDVPQPPHAQDEAVPLGEVYFTALPDGEGEEGGQGPGKGSQVKKGKRLPIYQGSCLGPYRILDIIGEGGLGCVYLAEDSQSTPGTRVALKIPRIQSSSPDEVDLYRSEASHWQNLSENHHPSIQQLYHIERFTPPGVIAFVMEFVEGRDLACYLREHWERGPLPVEEAIRIAQCVAEALRVIHDQGVYHGDLKPSNILIRKEDNAVQVTDFSIAHSLANPAHPGPQSLTVGTPAYLAPEIWEGKPTLQSDLFALGVIFFEMITGMKPFTGTNLESLRAAILSGQPIQRPSQRRSDVTFALERIILRCLEPQLEARYCSIKELIDDLQDPDLRPDLVTRLAHCILDHAAPEDLDFLVQEDLPARGYQGTDSRSLVMEYCLFEDPLQILLSCFSKGGLARLANRLGVPPLPRDKHPDREHYARAILGQLGVSHLDSPRGIQDRFRRVHALRQRLEQGDDAGDLDSLVSPGVHEYEQVLRDLLRFYGQCLFGRSHEHTLIRLAREHLAQDRHELSTANLDELMKVFQTLSEYLAGESHEALHFRKVFGQSHAIAPEHLSGVSIPSLLLEYERARTRANVRELLTQIAGFLEKVEQAEVYPRVIAIESLVTDRYGRAAIHYRDDQGQQKKAFTNVAIDPSRHYFIHPSHTAIFPILIPLEHHTQECG